MTSYYSTRLKGRLANAGATAEGDIMPLTMDFFVSMDILSHKIELAIKIKLAGKIVLLRSHHRVANIKACLIPMPTYVPPSRR